jgi:hypothetical protein
MEHVHGADQVEQLHARKDKDRDTHEDSPESIDAGSVVLPATLETGLAETAASMAENVNL